MLQEESTVQPADMVITYIKKLMLRGELAAGMRLPAERKLAEDLGVSRTHVRSALQKLEFYGLISTLPQSGSVVSDLHAPTLDTLISDVMSINHYDFMSLVETRLMLERESVRLASLRATNCDIDRLWLAHQDYIDHMHTDTRIDKDLFFHRLIAQTSGNKVIKSMLLIITPDIMHHYQVENFCNTPSPNVIEEHRKLIEAIEARDPVRAESMMRMHLDDLYTYAVSTLEKQHDNARGFAEVP